jgi:tripartite-type tricarboxylate transporter receptor subunit TctC
LPRRRRTGKIKKNHHGEIQVQYLRTLSSVAALFASVAFASPASAQDWPNRTITVIVPLGAGSASDIISRVVMEQVGRQVGQTVIVENRPGAGGTIGANMVAKAAPDGYTVLVYGAFTSAPALYSKLPYDTLNDFVPVTSLGQQPLVIVSSPAKGYKTLGDLIAAAKANPTALNYSSAGIGSSSHFGAERLRASAAFEAQHIPFKGAAEAVTDVIAGRSDFSVQLTATTLPQIQQGALVALAVSAHKRVAQLPNVPTTIEAGLPADSVYPFFSGVYLPAKTPPDIVERLHGEIARALSTPAVLERLATLGVEPMPFSQAQFAAFARDDVAANIALVKAAKIPTQ